MHRRLRQAFGEIANVRARVLAGAEEDEPPSLDPYTELLAAHFCTGASNADHGILRKQCPDHLVLAEAERHLAVVGFDARAPRTRAAYIVAVAGVLIE